MAVCVLTAFSGSVAAQEVISINEEDTDALVDVDGSGGAGSSGGGGGGSVDVGNDQANGGGGAEVEVSPDGGTVDVGGGGAAGDREVSGGVECTFTAAPEAPDCEPETPGDGGGSVPQVDTDHDSSLGPDGGSGEGSVEVTSEQGDFDGDAEVAGSPDEGAYLLVEGEGSAQDQVVGGGVECDIPAGQPDDPSTVCQPVGDNGGVPSLPSPPGDGIPSPPGDGLPDLPSVPSPPGDEIPSPGDGLPDVPSVPSPPGGGIPISGLQAL